MKDVFGQALYEYWNGDRSTPYIIRRDDGYVSKASLKEYFATWLEPGEKAVLDFVQGKILDVGCGAGRHVLYFQDRGFDITGLDFSPLAIKVCQESGCDQTFHMNIFEHSLPSESFDTLFLFGHNIGIGGTLEGAENLLLVLRKLVKNDGALLLTTSDVLRTSNVKHLQYHNGNHETGKYTGEIRIRVEYKELIGDWFNWIHVDPENLERLAENTGWMIQETFGYFDNDYAAVLKPFLKK